jgi:cytochrome P450
MLTDPCEIIRLNLFTQKLRYLNSLKCLLLLVHAINMHSALIALAALVVFLTARRFFFSYQLHRKAVQLGCQPPPARYYKLPLALDITQKLAASVQNNELPPYQRRVAAEMAPAVTWSQPRLGLHTIATVDPENIKAILATKFADYDMGLRRGALSPIAGHGIFVDDGERWSRGRAMLRPTFARDQLANIELLEQNMQNLFQSMLSKPRTGGWSSSLDMMPLILRFTLDGATETLFGESAGAQIGGMAEGDQKDSFGIAFDGALLACSWRVRFGPLYWLYNPKHLRENMKVVSKFVNYYVDLALQRHKTDDTEKTIDEKSKRYVFAQELVKSTQDRQEIRDQLLNILIAGRDTTSGLLGFTLWELARRPEVFKKLRNIVLETFGTYDSPRNLDFESLKSCTYLQHTLQEGLRLYPSVPINMRWAIRDTVLPRGGGPDGKSPVFVPKGTELSYCVSTMHRREDLWGQDAEDFRPERWVNRKAGWEFLPFNGGPRICLGQQYALTTAAYFLVRLVQRFDALSVPEQMQPGVDYAKYNFTFTIFPLNLKVQFHDTQA